MRTISRRFAKRLVGSTTTRRFVWARWAITRSNALTARRRLYRRTNVEWDVPGHARLVFSEILGPGHEEVLVRTIASAVSPGTERASFRGETSSAKFPALPGYSLAGEVVAKGHGVAGLELGDLVSTQGPHASLVVRPKDVVFRIGPGTDPEQAAMLYPAMIALHGIWRGGLAPGERVGVLGRGIIGQLALILARAHGVGELTSVARSHDHVTAAVRASADHIVASAAGDSIPNGELDLVIEATGDPSAIADAVEWARPGGRVVLLGSPRRAVAFDFSSAAERRVELIGAHISSLSRPPRPDGRDYQTAAITFLQLLEHGSLDLSSLVGQRINPWEAGWFYRALSNRSFGHAGAVFRWDHLSDEDRGGPIHYASRPVADFVRGMTFKRYPIGSLPMEKS